MQSHRLLTGSSYKTKYSRISSYIRKTFLIYDFAPAPYLQYNQNFPQFFNIVASNEFGFNQYLYVWTNNALFHEMSTGWQR